MTMMKNLEGAKIYISGPIDRVDDDGIGWRKEIKRKCKKAGLPVVFLDPTDKPKGLGSEIGEEKIRIHKLMQDGKWEQAQSQAKYVRHMDLRMVDVCHLCIVYIDITSHCCGTYDELFTAEKQSKPIFAIMAPGQSKWELPSWLVSIFNEDEVFENVELCVEHLKLLHEGKIIFDDRWIMV